jgi:hypothetical protein
MYYYVNYMGHCVQSVAVRVSTTSVNYSSSNRVKCEVVLVLN